MTGDVWTADGDGYVATVRGTVYLRLIDDGVLPAGGVSVGTVSGSKCQSQPRVAHWRSCWSMVRRG